MIIEYDGKKCHYDPDDLDIEQALKIEQHLGGPMIEWEKGMVTGSAKCVQVLGWLIMHGGDLDVPIASVNFKYKKLQDAFMAAMAEEEAEAAKAAPDPTGNGHVAASTGRKSARASSPSGSATSAPGT